MRQVEQDSFLVRRQEHLDCVIEPAFLKPMTFSDSLGCSPDIANGFKDGVDVLSVRPRVVRQRHHRATIQTNLALYIHRTQLVIQFRQISLYLFGAHPSMVSWTANALDPIGARL